MTVIKLILDPGEMGLVGEMVVTNANEDTIELDVQGDGAVLRSKLVIKPIDAISPALKIYYMVTCMYMRPDGFEENQKEFLELSRQLVTEVPSTGMIMADIGECLIINDLRGAYEKCFDLLSYEALLEEIALSNINAAPKDKD